jgi:hypothetical protein
MSLSKKVATDTLTSACGSTSDLTHTSSCQDLFSCDSKEQAKEMIINGVRHECHNNNNNNNNNHHHHNRTVSEHTSIETMSSKVDTTIRTVSTGKHRQFTNLLAGPRFRAHTMKTTANIKRDSIYSTSVRSVLSTCRYVRLIRLVYRLECCGYFIVNNHSMETYITVYQRLYRWLSVCC